MTLTGLAVVASRYSKALLPQIAFTPRGAVVPSTISRLPWTLPRREAFPPCVWKMLNQLCMRRYSPRSSAPQLYAEWARGAKCVTRPAHGESVMRGYLKLKQGATHVELETELRGVDEPNPGIVDLEASRKSLTHLSHARTLAEGLAPGYAHSYTHTRSFTRRPNT